LGEHICFPVAGEAASEVKILLLRLRFSFRAANWPAGSG
jgi:hypothetical protein